MNYVILATAKDKDEAEMLAHTLLKEKLIACANIIDSVRSMFWWEGNIDQADETMLILKTKKEHLNEIIKRVKELHSYDVPEVICLPVEYGNKDYLSWINQSTIAD